MLRAGEPDRGIRSQTGRPSRLHQDALDVEAAGSAAASITAFRPAATACVQAEKGSGLPEQVSDGAGRPSRHLRAFIMIAGPWPQASRTGAEPGCGQRPDAGDLHIGNLHRQLSGRESERSSLVRRLA